MDSSHARNSTRADKARSVKSVPKPRRNPIINPLNGRRTRAAEAAESLRISPTQAAREMRDGVPATALRHIRNRLEIAMSVAYVTGAALKDQGANVDREAALALQRCVGDELDQQIERIDGLIGGVAS